MFTRPVLNYACITLSVRPTFARYKPLKSIPPEPYLQAPEDSQKQFNAADYPQWNIKHYRDIKATHKRGLTEEPQPVVAAMGPIRVQSPKIE